MSCQTKSPPLRTPTTMIMPGTTRVRTPTTLITRADAAPEENDLPSREAGLKRLWTLPKLVALKILTPAQANSMSRSTQIYLDQTRTSQSGTSARPANDDVLANLRANPDLLEWIEPYLSDERLRG